jgi:hypothetical protein
MFKAINYFCTSIPIPKLGLDFGSRYQNLLMPQSDEEDVKRK